MTMTTTTTTTATTMAGERIAMRIEPMPGQTVVAAAHQHIGGAQAFVVVVAAGAILVFPVFDFLL